MSNTTQKSKAELEAIIAELQAQLAEAKANKTEAPVAEENKPVAQVAPQWFNQLHLQCQITMLLWYINLIA